MQKKIAFFFCLASVGAMLGLQACSSLISYSAWEYDDKTTGEHLRRMENNKLGLMQKPEESYDPKELDGVYLNVIQATTQGHDAQYRLEITVRHYALQDTTANPAANYFKIKNGNSLFFYVDGETFFFATSNASRPEGDEFGGSDPRQSGNNYVDTAVYGTDREFLNKLAAAQTVRVKLFGEKTSREVSLTAWNQKNIRSFLEVPAAAPK
jgi:hypothetical protein